MLCWYPKLNPRKPEGSARVTPNLFFCKDPWLAEGSKTLRGFVEAVLTLLAWNYIPVQWGQWQSTRFSVMTSSWIQGQHPRLSFVPFLFGLWAARIQSRARQASNLLSLETCSFELRKHLKAPRPTGIPQVLGHALHPTFNRVIPCWIPWPIKDTNFFF